MSHDDYRQYTVKAGDTLTGIAHQYYGEESPADLSREVTGIAKANHISNPNMIYPGEQLLIPPMPSGHSAGTIGNNENMQKESYPRTIDFTESDKTDPNHRTFFGLVAEEAAIGAGTGAVVGAVGGLGVFDEVTVPGAAIVGGVIGALVGAVSYGVQEIKETF